MKYMQSCRQTLVQLSTADEIRMDYKDIDRIRDFVTETWTCPVDVVIYIPKEEQNAVNWDVLKSYQGVLSIVIALEDAYFAPKVLEQGFPWFWSYPVSTFWELRGILDLGVCQVLIDAPIFFELPQVYEWCEEYDVEIRVIANQVYNKYMPRDKKQGIFGVYIRPEDIPYYEPYVRHIEFETNGLKQERTYINIYKKDTIWPGSLKLLFPKIDYDVINGAFEPGFGRRRLTCRQRCQSTGRCQYCKIQAKLLKAIEDNYDLVK